MGFFFKKKKKKKEAAPKLKRAGKLNMYILLKAFFVDHNIE